jgi:hypothetical protein
MRSGKAARSPANCGRQSKKSAGPEFVDRGVVEVFFGRAFDGVVDFARGGCGGKRNADLVAEFEREAQVFVHQAQREARLVIGVEHDGSFGVEHARASHTGLHDFDELVALQAGAGNEGEGFGERVHLKGEKKVHRELDSLACAAGAEMEDFFAHGGEDGTSSFESLSIATNHEEEFAFFGAPGATGDGRVEEADTGFGRSIGDFAREGGRDGAGIEINCAFFESEECAAGFFIGSPQNLLERGRIADDGDENVGGHGGFFGRTGEASTGGDERIGARCGAVPDNERETGFEEIVTHGSAHQAEADEADGRLQRQECLRKKLDEDEEGL